MASGKPDTARTVPWGRPEMLPAEMRAGTGTEVPQPSAAPHPTSNSLRRLIDMEARRLCGPPWIHISNSLREYLSMAEPLTEDELAELEGETRAVSVWALDEADVRMLLLRRRALEELRKLRAAFAELSAADAELRQRLENAEQQLALVRGAG